MSTSLPVSTDAVSCYHASMANTIWFTDEKCSPFQQKATWAYEISHLTMIRSKNSTISQAVCPGALYCWKV